MAIGDAAAAAGLATWASTQDRKLGYQNDNQRGDELAAHMTSGGHNLASGQSGVLPVSNGGTGKTTLADLLGAMKVVRSSGGVGMQDHAMYFGWNGSVLIAQVDSTPLGAVVTGSVQRPQTAVDTGSGSLRSAWARSNPVVSSWVSCGIDGNGYFGYTPSVRSSKQDIKPWAVDLDTFMSIGTQQFRYKQAVAEQGDEAPIESGLIADDLVDAGLGQFAFNDPRGGELAGLNYDRLTIVLWSVVQQQQAQIAALTERVETLEGSHNG